jgi:CheY-like chemotaxis protein
MKRILIIDDDKFPTTYYVKYLQATGKFDVRWEQRIDRILQYLSEPYDVVILDIMMPPGDELAGEDCSNGMTSGVVILNKLRSLHPKLPILILTNVKDETTLERCRKYTKVRVLSKIEYHPAKLRDEIDEFLA